MANESEIERWNGAAAGRWLASRERHAGVRHGLLPHLLRAADVRPGERVLDVGCGCGDLTRMMASSGYAVGVDVSEPLLAVARAEAPGVRFVRGDAQVHPFPPGHFDVVVSSFGVMFFDDPVAAFRNLRGGLRAGGRLAFLCWQHALHNEVFAIPLRALRDFGGPSGDRSAVPREFGGSSGDRFAVPREFGGSSGDRFAVSREFGGQPEDPFAALRELGGPSGDPFADPRWIEDMLGRAGYVEVVVEPVEEPARLGSDVADVLAYATDTSQVRELLEAVGDEDLARRIVGVMAEQFEARRRDDGVWVRAAAYLVTARNAAGLGAAA